MFTKDQKLIDLLNLDSFGEFVDSQDPNTEYAYNDNGFDVRSLGIMGTHSPGCALVRYLRHHGYKNVCVSPVTVYPNIKDYPLHMVDLPEEINKLVLLSRTEKGINTFGVLSKNIKERKLTKKKLELINS